MYYQMNRSHMAAMLAEDVYAPELRNPRNSGMSRIRKPVMKQLTNGLNRLFRRKQ